MSKPRVLALDIETLPAQVVAFDLFKPVFNPNHVIEHPRMGGFSYMWEGWKRAKWESEYHSAGGRMGMLEKIHSLLNEADIVIHYNGASFDMPWIRGELLTEGFTPPSPVQQIDLYRAIKKNSRFISKKLDYVSQRLLSDRKVQHSGIDMWIGCLKGQRRPWDDMRKYALKDTELLFPLYEKLKPWIDTGHPNIALHEGKDFGCTACGSVNAIRQGHAFTAAGKFQRYRCSDCGKWFRGLSRIATTEGR